MPSLQAAWLHYLDKMLTFGHLQASLHGSRSIAFLDKMLTLNRILHEIETKGQAHPPGLYIDI